MANGTLNAGDGKQQQQQQQQQQQLRYNSGLSMEWSAEEQSILNEKLVKYGNYESVWKYIKLASFLANKTARDVALRCQWMSKKEAGKKRKLEEQQPKKTKKDRIVDMKPSTASKPMPLYGTPLPIDTDDGISNEAIGGAAGELFEQNRQVVLQIRANLAAGKAQENTDLLVKFRENLYSLLEGMSNTGSMSQLPSLQISIDTDLADSILPKSLLQGSQ